MRGMIVGVVLALVVHGNAEELGTKRIGKAQDHEILDRFLPEVVIDSEDLIFAENSTNRIVPSSPNRLPA